MKLIRVFAPGLMFAFLVAGVVSAEENALKGVKLGFGFDRGLGVIATMGELNGFLGNDGVAVDYILKKKMLKLELDGTVLGYIGAGGYGDWDGDFGARVPVGAEWLFAKNLDAYVQLVPRLRVIDKFKFGLGFGIGVRYQF